MFSKIAELSLLHLPTSEYIAAINSRNFRETALSLFYHQYRHNKVYRAYCDALRVDDARIGRIEDIPFLPISFFKTHRVQTGDWQQTDLIFESSGTTGEIRSNHFIKEAALYEESLLTGFSATFGPVEDWTFLALLPSYLERQSSSLVHMMRVLMARSGAADNGFYLNEWEALAGVLQHRKSDAEKTLLIGVTFALIDFAEAFPIDLSGITVMETGGMKGRREEWTRGQVHEHLRDAWNLQEINSEYGMTELLSQAYAVREGLFTPSPTMQVFVREPADPLVTYTAGYGVLNIIDLTNVHSCAFIATEDMGVVHDTSTFEVLGRVDHAALRGCSLMTT